MTTELAALLDAIAHDEKALADLSIENAALRADVARLTAERDSLRAALVKCAELVELYDPEAVCLTQARVALAQAGGER